MINNRLDLLVLSRLTDEMLVNQIYKLDQQIKQMQTYREKSALELIQRLENREARELAHPTLEVKLEYPSPTYDVAKLRALAEAIPPEEYALAYQREHVKEVQVPARFDGRVLNTLARKYGKPVAEIMAGAKLPSSPRLNIQPKT